MPDSHRRTIVKTVIWRVFNFVYWPVIAYAVTGSWKSTGLLTIGAIVGMFLYYGYERLWNNIQWGKLDK